MYKPFDLTEDALADVEELITSLAKGSKSAASSLVESLDHAFLFLGTWPGAGHRKQHVTSEENIRFWNANGYLIAYDADRSPILILCVLHGARDLPSVLTSRLEQR